ncbi:centrosomal protein of 76 kDa-like isoform X2 [Limulus polyphemus]|uniref:Centrosomal protein of 76 kDa-like isoform X2 n=1 Tax=Limulus polyphemus TaxID=6850 RepID=A0ABM1B9F4_LIMPO|nr:centrosomal protein of 76 kDa-like isoform X2 [Limulus polyphemus]
MNNTLIDRNELRDKIHEYLREKDLKTRIKSALSSKENKIRQKISCSKLAAEEDSLLKILHQQRIVDELVSHLVFSDIAKKAETTHEDFKELQQNEKTDTVDSSFLKDQNVYKVEIRIKQGRAFVECLLEPPPIIGQPLPTLTIHGHFQGQRSKSTPVPAVCEPEFFCTLSFDLHAKTQGLIASDVRASSLSEIDSPVHLVLVRTEPNGENKLMSSCFLEWRKVLTSPNGCLSIHTELKGIGVENKVPIGILDMELCVNPTPKSLITECVLNTQLSLEKTQYDEKQILFLTYSKLWWQEYLEIRPEHSLRLVKIFTQDENAVALPVVCYVKPLRVGRLIESPQEALWFVSLFHQQKCPVVGKVGITSQEQWNNLFAFLVVQGGGSEDHAVFLCSLLLGFGLNAYVCIGTVGKEVPYAWVITFGRTDNITFWDVASATRYKHCSAQKDCSKTMKPKHPFKTVGCIFNHQSFFANCQPTDSIERCCFDLNDPSKWKSMSTDAIALISTTIPSWPTMLASTIDVSKASLDLEEQLKVLITEHRADKGLTTYWDENLCFILSSALSTCEIQGRSGVPAYHEDFQDAVHPLVPEGHTFKALPVHFCHRNAWKVFKETLRSALGEEIICCHGDKVRMAVRAHVYAYPENILSVWIMFSTKYKCII